MKTLAMSVLLVSCCSASLRGAGEEQGPLTWDAPKMRELERELNDLYATFTEPSTKINYEERANLVDRLLGSRLTLQELRALATDADQVPGDARERDALEHVVISRMVWVFLKQGDRKSLVTLLSKCCPERYHFIDIEEMVVIHGEKLKDPIKVLAEALVECKRPPARKVIMSALRRAFEGSGIRGANDDEFVKNAMAWYDREKDKLERNPNYYPPAGFGMPKQPLFWFKDSLEAVEARRPTIPKLPPMPARD
jgi:hypothetical protein